VGVLQTAACAGRPMSTSQDGSVLFVIIIGPLIAWAVQSEGFGIFCIFLVRAAICLALLSWLL
jgi:hypothetical protein